MDYFEILRSIETLVSHLSKRSMDDKIEVAKHFKNLSETFNKFPIAHSNGDINEMIRLTAKTQGLLDSLRTSRVFINFLGNESENFFGMIQEISTAKDLLSNDHSAEKLRIIIKAAGYFEGYYETLSAVDNNI